MRQSKNEFISDLNRTAVYSRLLAHVPLCGLALARASRGAATSALTFEVETRGLDVNGKAAKVFGLTVDGKLGGFAHAVWHGFFGASEQWLAEDTLIHWHGLTPPLARMVCPVFRGRR